MNNREPVEKVKKKKNSEARTKNKQKKKTQRINQDIQCILNQESRVYSSKIEGGGRGMDRQISKKNGLKTN